MRFGLAPVSECEGCLLGHAVTLGDGRLNKGHTLTLSDITRLETAGYRDIIVARMDAGDIPEDEAAMRVTDAMPRDHLRFSPASTGRVNIYAAVDGVFVADPAVVNTLNRVDPAITLACLADHVPVRSGDMVATVKVIPLAVSSGTVDAAIRTLDAGPAFGVKPYRPHNVALVSTILPGLKPSVMEKTRRTLEARLRPSGSRLQSETRVAHEAEAIAAAIAEQAVLCDMIVVFGASAVADSDDVVPAGLRLAGGSVDYLGMPVDPGNLLILGHLGDTPVLGAPGCARSPKENGFDWVLNRILVGEHPTAHDISGMGVGGLLMEIPSRPQPREIERIAERVPTVSIVVLAAGRASRMGASGHHKLLAEFEGVPLVRRSVETALGAGCDEVVVVTGHRSQDIRTALGGLDVVVVDNPNHAEGMASSLKAGLVAMSSGADGMLVVLADMPAVRAADLSRLLDAFRREKGAAIVRAVYDGKRGNPVLLPSATFSAVRQLDGDVGARQVVETCGLPIIDVELGAAAHLDVDTMEAVIAAGGVLKG